MSIVVEVERQIGWPRPWDFALDHGPRCIDGLRSLVRVITFPPHALSACPLCEEENVPRDSLLLHVLNSHTRKEASTAATIFYHYFHQSLTLTQFCLTICIPWPTYFELPFLIIFHCIFSLLIITCFSCMPMPMGLAIII